mgnify:CR=1 FL=1
MGYKMKGFSGFKDSPMKNDKSKTKIHQDHGPMMKGLNPKTPSLPPKKLSTLPGELDDNYNKKMEPTKPAGKPGKKYGEWIGELD